MYVGAWKGRFRFGARLLAYFGGSRRARGRQPNEQRSEPERFGGHWGCVWGPFLYVLIILNDMWASGGCFEVVLPHFHKTFIFQ